MSRLFGVSIFHQVWPKIAYSQIRNAYSYKGKKVVITGAAKGLGAGFADILLKKGVQDMVISDIDIKGGKETARKLGGKVQFMKCDVSKKNEVKELLQKSKESLKGLDLVINNAGTLNSDDSDFLIATNANGVVYGTFEAMRLMGKNHGGKGGVVVNVGSILSLRGCTPFAVYSGTKHFVAGFSRSMGTPFYYNLTGVKIMVICPGFTETPLLHNVRMPKEFEGLLEYAAELVKKQNIQGPEYVSECLLHMLDHAKNGSTWVTTLKKKPFEAKPAEEPVQ